jgi:hypothetical protein
MWNELFWLRRESIGKSAVMKVQVSIKVGEGICSMELICRRTAVISFQLV